jgi:predicted outer membrane protein
MRGIQRAAAALLVGTSLLAAGACTHTTTIPSSRTSSVRGAPQTTGVTERQGTARRLSAADDAFFRRAYSDASAGLVIGHLAQQRGASVHVRRLGQQLVSDSTHQLKDLKDFAATNGVGLPATLEPADQAAVSRLSVVTGRTFDRDFLTHVQQREQSLLSALRGEEKSGANAGLRSYANRQVTVVRAQADRARGVTAPQRGVTAPQRTR